MAFYRFDIQVRLAASEVRARRKSRARYSCVLPTTAK
jgi:hypothetical protein